MAENHKQQLSPEEGKSFYVRHDKSMHEKVAVCDFPLPNPTLTPHLRTWGHDISKKKDLNMTF